jgi:hypothetical protein
MKKKPATRLVQTRIPKDVATWLEGCAESDGDSVAGWLRRFIIHEKRRSEEQTQPPKVTR